MTDNNQNEFSDACAYAGAQNADMQEMCRGLDVYPAGYPGYENVIIQAEIPIGNDMNNMTLNEVNAKDEDPDVKEFHNLDKCKIVGDGFPNMARELPPPSEGIIWRGDDEPMDWDPMGGFADSKQPYYNYVMDEPPMEVNRMDMSYQVDAPPTSGALLSLDDTSYPPSPTSTICSFASEQINNNENHKRVPRSRKMSVKLGGGKVEKPYRSRRTKADMEEMTTKEKIELKQEQNRINAKLCVARKNKDKKKFSKELPELEQKLELLQEKNQKQKDGLCRGYERFVVPMYDNNSPYGIPSDFQDLLNEKKDNLAQMIVRQDDGNVLELKNKMDEAHDKYDEVLGQDQTKIKQATYASRKSRAKSNYDLATAKYHNAEHRLDIAIEQTYWNELVAAAKVLNPYFREQGRPVFPEDPVHVEFDQYEPS